MAVRNNSRISGREWAVIPQGRKQGGRNDHSSAGSPWEIYTRSAVFKSRPCFGGGEELGGQNNGEAISDGALRI